MNLNHELLSTIIFCMLVAVEGVEVTISLVGNGNLCALVKVKRFISVYGINVPEDSFSASRQFFFENCMLLLLPGIIKIIITRKRKVQISPIHRVEPCVDQSVRKEQPRKPPEFSQYKDAISQREQRSVPKQVQTLSHFLDISVIEIENDDIKRDSVDYQNMVTRNINNHEILEVKRTNKVSNQVNIYLFPFSHLHRK